MRSPRKRAEIVTVSICVITKRLRVFKTQANRARSEPSAPQAAEKAALREHVSKLERSLAEEQERAGDLERSVDAEKQRAATLESAASEKPQLLERVGELEREKPHERQERDRHVGGEDLRLSMGS